MIEMEFNSYLLMTTKHHGGQDGYMTVVLNTQRLEKVAEIHYLAYL